MIAPEEMIVGVAGTSATETCLKFVETEETFVEPPPADVAAGWRATGRSFGLVAWQVLTHPRSAPGYKEMTTPIPEHAAVGHFARSRWTDEAWDRTDAFARAVRSPVLVLRTPKSFRPTPEHERRLDNFLAIASRSDLAIAWQWARGSWPDARARAFAERSGLCAVIDPTEEKIPGGELLYLRVCGGPSERRSPTDDKLKRIAEQVRDRAGWVVFANATAERDAQRLARIL